MRVFPLRVLCCVGFSESVTLRNLAFGKKPWKPVSRICCFPGIFCSPQSHPCADALCGGLCIISLFSCLCFLCLPFFLFAPPIAILAFGCLCIFSVSKLCSLTQSVCCVCTVCFLPLLFICPFLLWLGDFYFLFSGRGEGHHTFLWLFQPPWCCSPLV